MKIDFDSLPNEVLQYVIQLRKEAAQYRNQRNDARAAVSELQAQVGALQSDIETLHQGIDPRCGAPVDLTSR
jgi:phage shock protein A